MEKDAPAPRHTRPPLPYITRLYTHCSYWDPARADRLDRLRLLVGLGLAGPDIARRIHLIQRVCLSEPGPP